MRHHSVLSLPDLDNHAFTRPEGERERERPFLMPADRERLDCAPFSHGVCVTIMPQGGLLGMLARILPMHLCGKSFVSSSWFCCVPRSSQSILVRAAEVVE